MKKVNLTIVIPDEIKQMEESKDDIVIAKKWLEIGITRALNQPNEENRATQQSAMEIQRKYDKVLDAIDSVKDGVFEIEDDHFKWMKETWDKVKFPVGKSMSKLLSLISEKLIEAEKG